MNLNIHPADHYSHILESGRVLPRITVAVIHPVDDHALEAAADAQDEGLITPILIGPQARIRKAAQENGTDISGWTLIDVEHSHAAAETGAAMAARGEVDALMKGALHTDELLTAVVAKEAGLRTPIFSTFPCITSL